MAWNWDGVAFRILSPSDGQQFALKSSNNRSCVLLISYREQHILLPGDIERTAERELLGEKLPVMTLLVAPHHGSKTSSSKRFLAAIQPQHVVFSAGYRHHFGHPHAEVVTRYQSLGAKQWNTATSGAVIFSWDEQGLLQVSEARHRWRRYWF